MKTLRQRVYEDTGYDSLSPFSIARDQRLRLLYEDYVAKKPGSYEALRDFIRDAYVVRGHQWERDGWSADFLEAHAVEVERKMENGGVSFVRWDDGTTSRITAKGTGARLGETKQIWWAHVSLEDKKVSLGGHMTKSKKPRTLPLTNELVEILSALPDKTNWKPVFDVTGLRDAWERAVKKADYPNLVIHDFRRAAIRNMMRAGVQQSVAMKISGHSTIDIFRRYDITDETDLHAAADLIESKRK